MYQLRSLNVMKTLITLTITLVLFAPIGCQPSSRGVKSGAVRENVPMSRLSGTLVSADSDTDGVGKPSSDSGISSFFS
jgi:hypothetical protein